MYFMGIHRSSHAVWECQYHLVWSTKYRKKIFVEDELRDACKDRLMEIADQYGMNITAIELDVDHIHLSIEVPPQKSVGSAVGVLKSLSARFMFRHFPGIKKNLWAGKLWEASYFVRGIGEGVTADMVKKYINQHSEKAENCKQLKLFPTEKA